METNNLKNKTILFISRSTGYGGTEKVILQLCEIFLPYVKKIVVCSNGNIKKEYLKEIGVAHYDLPDIEKKDLLTVFKVIKILNYVIKKEGIDIVHSHHRMAAMYAQLLRHKYKYVMFATAHTNFYDKKMMTKLAYKNTNIIACGQNVKENLVSYFGFSSNVIKVVKNAVKKEEFTEVTVPIIKEKREEGFFIVGNIARLSYEKGVEYYINSIPEVLKENNKVFFVIVGAGPLEQELKQKADGLNIKDNLSFLGYREDVQNVINQLDLVILSSLTEGLPLTPIEAFAYGKPVVGTSINGTMEIVEDQKNGFLVEPQNSKQIAEKIIWLVNHKEEFETMKENARDSYINNFSMKSLEEGYIDCYKECLA